MSTRISAEPRTLEEEIEFRRLRKSVIGGSDLRRIFLGEWGDARTVYYDKVRPLNEDEVRREFENGRSVDIDRGHTFEPIIAARFFNRTERRGRDEERRPHPEFEFLNPEPDRIQFSDAPGAPAGGTGALEIKAPRAAGFRKVVEADAVRDGDLLQLQYQLLCRGYEWGTHVYGSWEHSSGPIIYFDIERSEDISEWLVERLVTFWREHVQRREPPDPDDWLLDEASPSLPEPVGSDYWTPESLSETPEEIKDLVERAKRLKKLKKEVYEEYGNVRAAIEDWIREHRPENAGVEVPTIGKARVIEQSGRTRLKKDRLRQSRPIDRDAFVRWLCQQFGNSAEAAEQIAERLEIDFTEFEEQDEPNTYVGIY